MNDQALVDIEISNLETELDYHVSQNRDLFPEEREKFDILCKRYHELTGMEFNRYNTQENKSMGENK
ncbi:hypothetical protein J4477_03830 [Candidatus Pacearchaeota archaeon]|nr:hypothetical protein [Candidatus Pacearchaeota archaeon]